MSETIFKGKKWRVGGLIVAIVLFIYAYPATYSYWAGYAWGIILGILVSHADAFRREE